MIPLLKPKFHGEETAAISEVMNSGWWGMGKVTEQLEHEFADYVGAKYAVAVNSGTAALHLAVKVLKELGNYKKLNVPALTFASTAMVGLYEGLEIVFQDISEKTLCSHYFDANELNINVHYAGHISGTPAMIEDCAHAAGSKQAGKYSGLACWSFHAVKNLAAGDGGMITTDEEEIYKHLRRLRWLGIDKDTYTREVGGYNWEYDIKEVGLKAHMNDITAAIAIVQLKHLDDMNGIRAAIAATYSTELKDLPITLPPLSDTWHLYVIRLKNRDKFVEYMLDKGISVGVHYKPLNHYSIFPDADLPVTEKVYKEICSLPIFPDLTNTEQDYIIQTIKEWFENSNSSSL